MMIKLPAFRRHLFPVIFWGIIAFVELGVRIDRFALLMVFFLIVLASRTAQILWASVLVVEMGLLLLFTDTDLVRFVEGDFLIVRVLFLAVLVAFGSLFATHTLVRNLRVRVEATRLSIWIVFASTCLIICAGLVLFDIVHWYRYASWAALFFVLAWRCPKPVRGEKSTWSERAANGTLLLVTFVLCLILLEVGLRVFAAPPAYVIEGGVIRAHETAGYAYIENSTQTQKTSEYDVVYSISSQGLRDRVYGEKEQGVYRIVCVGDSLTFGHGVNQEEAYPKVLERVLAINHPERRIEVVNMGTSGYGLWQSEIRFREIGLALEPDLLVVQVFPENDVRDALRHEGIVLQAYNENYHNLMDNLDKLQRRMRTGRLRRLSRTFDLSYYFLQPKYQFVHSKLRAQFRRDNHDVRIVKRVQTATRPWTLETFLIERYPDLEYGFYLVERTMAELVALCEEEGIAVVILYVPGRRTTYIGSTSRWLKNRDFEASIYDFQRPSDWMDDLCAAQGWPLVNTKNTFERRGRSEKDLMYTADGHPTDRGHQLIADLLGGYVETTYLSVTDGIEQVSE